MGDLGCGIVFFGTMVCMVFTFMCTGKRNSVHPH